MGSEDAEESEEEEAREDVARQEANQRVLDLDLLIGSVLVRELDHAFAATRAWNRSSQISLFYQYFACFCPGMFYP